MKYLFSIIIPLIILTSCNEMNHYVPPCERSAPPNCRANSVDSAGRTDFSQYQFCVCETDIEIISYIAKR